MDEGGRKLAAGFHGIWYDEEKEYGISIVVTAGASIGIQLKAEIQDALHKTLEAGMDKGMSEKVMAQESRVLAAYRKVLRIKLGSGPPADV